MCHVMKLNKDQILQNIIEYLQNEEQIFMDAAKQAHKAATHEENVPTSKYETLALESSYIAQGQANRAAELREDIQKLKTLKLKSFNKNTPLSSGALVTVANEDNIKKHYFLSPCSGGVKIGEKNSEVILITASSKIGEEIFGATVGDTFEINNHEYEIVNAQ